MTDRPEALRAAVGQLERARVRRATDVEIQALNRRVHQLLEDLIAQTPPQPAAAAQAWRRPPVRLTGPRSG